jgi:hypothetical protein
MFTLMVTLLPQAVFLQGRPLPSSFSASERARLEQEQKVDGRIRIYSAASDERHRTILKAMSEQNSEAVSLALRSWTELLDFSLEDIRANAAGRSKSKALRNYEIQLRKALDSINDVKMRGTSGQLDEFEAWLGHAEEVRSRLVRILFPS